MVQCIICHFTEEGRRQGGDRLWACWKPSSWPTSLPSACIQPSVSAQSRHLRASFRGSHAAAHSDSLLLFILELGIPKPSYSPQRCRRSIYKPHWHITKSQGIIYIIWRKGKRSSLLKMHSTYNYQGSTKIQITYHVLNLHADTVLEPPLSYLSLIQYWIFLLNLCLPESLPFWPDMVNAFFSCWCWPINHV